MTPIRLIILPTSAEASCRQILFGPDDQVIEDTRLEYGGPWLDGAPVVEFHAHRDHGRREREQRMGDVHPAPKDGAADLEIDELCLTFEHVA